MKVEIFGQDDLRDYISDVYAAKEKNVKSYSYTALQNDLDTLHRVIGVKNIFTTQNMVKHQKSHNDALSNIRSYIRSNCRDGQASLWQVGNIIQELSVLLSIYSQGASVIRPLVLKPSRNAHEQAIVESYLNMVQQVQDMVYDLNRYVLHLPVGRYEKLLNTMLSPSSPFPKAWKDRESLTSRMIDKAKSAPPQKTKSAKTARKHKR